MSNANPSPQKPKVPGYVYAICALPLVMIVIGGAIGGALGGAGYALAVGTYQKKQSAGLAVAVSVLAAGVAFVIWLLVVSAMR